MFRAELAEQHLDLRVSTEERRLYRRGNFATRLPAGHLYTPSHAWLAKAPDGPEGRWRVGLTKFALRMLGELVEIQFTAAPGAAVQPGDVLGSVEGFKALSDIFCVGNGVFAGANAEVAADADLVGRDPYGAGWLYAFDGAPDARSLDARGYRQLLDETIDRLMAHQAELDKSA